MNKYQRFFENDRNYDDPIYKKFRKDVLKRDGYCCQWHGCGSTKYLRVHHIRTWAERPRLRFVVENGIVLCKQHHDQIWGKESDYERLFDTFARRNAKTPAEATRNKKPKRRSSRKKKNVGGNAKEGKGESSFEKRYAEAKKKSRRRKWRK